MSRCRLKRINPAVLIAASIVWLGIILTLLYRFQPEAFRVPNFRSALLSLLIAVLAELARAERLRTVYRSMGGSTSFWRALEARLASNLASLLTPSVFGGEVVRGVLLGGVKGRAVAAGFLDGGLELLGNYVVCIVAAATLSQSIVALVLNAPSAVLWASILATLMTSGVEKLAERLKKFRVAGRVADRLRELRVTERRLIVTAFALSIASWVGYGISYAIYSGLGLLEGLACASTVYLMGVVPVPGGIGPGEALVGYACPGIASWRVIITVCLAVVGAFTAGSIVVRYLWSTRVEDQVKRVG